MKSNFTNNSFFKKIIGFLSVNKKTKNIQKISKTVIPKNKDNPSIWSRVLDALQKLGRSLIYPIAVLPFAALMNRFGTLGVQVAVLQGHLHYADWWIATVIQTPGAVVFTHLPLLFALGTAFGWAKDNRGEAALVGGLFYIIITQFMQEGMLPSLFYKNVLTFHNSVSDNTYSSLFYVPTFDAHSGQITGQTYILDIGVFGGIVSGIWSAFLYNRFKTIKLPQALSFFGGRRFVPMVAGLTSIPMAFVFAIIWPWLQYVLVMFGTGISSSSKYEIMGAFFYGIINRALMPFGLHHILNTFLWFQLPVSGHIVNFLGQVKGDPSTLTFANGDINAFNKGIAEAGTFQSGYFPLFLGGEPGIALAMFFAIKNRTRRKEVGFFLVGVGTVAFLTGIDEPLVFSFVFISPLLWVLYALFTGVLCALVIACHIHIGFGFSAGLIDYIISFAQSWGNSRYYASTNGATAGFLANPLMIWPFTILAFGMCFSTFYLLIRRLNIMTPGCEPVDKEGVVTIKSGKSFIDFLENQDKDTPDIIDKSKPKKQSRKNKASQKYKLMADKIYAGINGFDNVISLINCATRLRFELKSNTKKVVDYDLIKSVHPLGMENTICSGQHNLQIIIGTDVESVLEPLEKLIAAQTALPKKEASSSPPSSNSPVQVGKPLTSKNN